MKTRCLSFALTMAATAMLWGCGSGGSTPPPPPEDVATVVTVNTTETATNGELDAMNAGDKLPLHYNHDTMMVETRDVTFVGTTLMMGMRRLAFRTPSDLMIGSGDSGSPPLLNGKIVGALAFGDDSDGHLFFVTPIGAMEDKIDPDVPARAVSGVHEIGLSWMARGPRGNRWSETVGHQLVDTRGVTDRQKGSNQAPGLIAGSSICIPLMKGMFEMTASGTATLVTANRVLAFGHPLFQRGPCSLPVYAGSCLTQVGAIPGMAPFKWIDPDYSRPIGELVQDRSTGVTIVRGSLPNPMTISVSVMYKGRQISVEHSLTRDIPELYSSLLLQAATIDAVVETTDRYDRPAKATGSLIWYEDGVEQIIHVDTEAPAARTRGGVDPNQANDSLFNKLWSALRQTLGDIAEKVSSGDQGHIPSVNLLLEVDDLDYAPIIPALPLGL